MNIGIIGLGYVGLPLAIEFSKKVTVFGFDINKKRISQLEAGVDLTKEITKNDLSSKNLNFTSDFTLISKCDYVIVTVPTPITKDKLPNLDPLISASISIAENMKKGTIIIYESTVYPGVTEEECVPILIKYSNLEYGKDFFVGYSPERINPGDKTNKLTSIKKIVSGQTEEILNKIAKLYELIITAGVYKASSIKVAEAAKVIENTQRDLNISLMNELAIIFEKLDIDTAEVIEAAGTKWNFLKFTPGLVGGHCIAVDPYYLTYKAEKVGYLPQVILAGRRINDSMTKLIATSIVKEMINLNMSIKNKKVVVLGVTFKENVPDIRNSKVGDLIKELEDFELDVSVIDPLADPGEVKKEFNVELEDISNISNAACVILAVPHNDFLREGWGMMERVLVKTNGIVYDIKSLLPKNNKPKNIILKRL